jgi:hypothetical protein
VNAIMIEAHASSAELDPAITQTAHEPGLVYKKQIFNSQPLKSKILPSP